MIDCASLTDEIEQTDQLMRERKELFHKMWEEEQARITIEQTIFKEQVRFFLRLRSDDDGTVILKPFAADRALLSSRRSSAVNGHSSTARALHQIHYKLDGANPA